MSIINLIKSEQKVVRIGNLEIGGKPGELPTTLCGCMFYMKHKIVIDHKRGIFNKKKAKELIEKQESLAEETGLQCMIDVFGETPEALINYLSFVSEVTDKPILLNGATPQVRIKALNYVHEVGLTERIVYTSVNYKSNDYEINAIKENKVRNVIIQTFNPRNLRPEGSLELVMKFIKKLDGVPNILVLATVLDLPSISLALESMYHVKLKLGLPVGIAPFGVVSVWSKRKKNEEFKRLCINSVLGMVKAKGADFIIYGSIRKAPYIFPTCALLDAIIAYLARFYGVKPKKKNHPLFRLMIK